MTFAAIPYYRGPAQFLVVARRAKRVVQSAARPDDAVILRIPSIIARLVESELNSVQHPFGVEVMEILLMFLPRAWSDIRYVPFYAYGLRGHKTSM